MKVYLVNELNDIEGCECKYVTKVFSTEEKAIVYMHNKNKQRGWEMVNHIQEMEIE